MVAANEAYLRGIAEARIRFRAHLRESGGPEADGTRESLAAVGAWFLHHLRDNSRDRKDPWLPAWWNPRTPLAGSREKGAAPFTRQQLRLIDEVHAYVAEVLLNEIPGAEWVIYTAHKRESRYGQTVLKLGRNTYDFPLSLVYGVAIDVVRLERTVDEDVLLDAASKIIARVR